MTTIPTFALNDGSSVPAIGFGTYPLRGREGTDATLSAIDAGYRLIDTAVNYRNEDAVGAAVRETDVPRDELVVATKLPGRDHGFEETITSCRGSLASLGLDRIDLYLIHWPNPSVGRFVESWKAMIQLQREGLVRSIGVSNFTEEFLTRLADETGVLPAVNQVELHPALQQRDVQAANNAHGVVTEAWSPLAQGGALLSEEAITTIADRLGRTPAQVVLRWHLQQGRVVIPKSVTPSRIAENIALFDFELTGDDLAAIDGLERDGRVGSHPAEVN